MRSCLRAAFFMPGRFYDLAADTEIDLDVEESEAAYLGYRSLSDTADYEWEGAQDPAEKERKRLARHGPADWYLVNPGTSRRTASKPADTDPLGLDVNSWD